MQDWEKIYKQIGNLPAHQQKEFLDLLKLHEKAVSVEAARTSFLPFVSYAWPEPEPFTETSFAQTVCSVVDDLLADKYDRAIINCPPRVGKSRLSSLMLPAYFLGRHPKKNIIMATHTREFSTLWGGRVRDLVQTPQYLDIFPDFDIRGDKKAAGNWATNQGGSYYSVGVGGRMTGRDADLIVIDDVHTEQDGRLGIYRPEVFDKTYEWYLAGPRQRIMKNTKILIIMTRWHQRDLTGQVLKAARDAGDLKRWKTISIPAINPDGTWIAPERFDLDYWLAVKTEQPTFIWNATYQQNPTAEEGAIIKREWWKPWEDKHPPKCKAILQSWDTAHTAKAMNDPSACTEWGVFEHEDLNGNVRDHVILLDAYSARLEFPDLKREVKARYTRSKPDILLVEARSSGGPLIQELRRMGVPVSEFTPSRGNDKITRVNAVSDIFSSGMVYFMPGKETQEVIEQCGSFPAGEHDDYVDTTTQALLRFRKGGLVNTDNDKYDDEDEDVHVRRPKRLY